jgi:hypothetical protein
VAAGKNCMRRREGCYIGLEVLISLGGWTLSRGEVELGQGILFRWDLPWVPKWR